MTWMLTSTGIAFDLRFVAADAISILDIAHHLSQINRFTGACSRPYSVAEHSLLVCKIVESQSIPPSPSVLLAALMHDAHEAYTTALHSPMKQLVGEGWAREEQRIQHAVLKRFNLLAASTSARDLIHWADMTALMTERKALLPDSGPEWQAATRYPPLGWIDVDVREAFTWRDWRQAFLDKFAELEFARNPATATT